MRRKGGGGGGEKLFVAEVKTSGGAFSAFTLFIMRMTCRSRLRLLPQAEHFEMWAIAASRASCPMRFSATSARTSSEICDEVFISDSPFIQRRDRSSNEMKSQDQTLIALSELLPAKRITASTGWDQLQIAIFHLESGFLGRARIGCRYWACPGISDQGD